MLFYKCFISKNVLKFEYYSTCSTNNKSKTHITSCSIRIIYYNYAQRCNSSQKSDFFFTTHKYLRTRYTAIKQRVSYTQYYHAYAGVLQRFKQNKLVTKQCDGRRRITKVLSNGQRVRVQPRRKRLFSSHDVRTEHVCDV